MILPLFMGPELEYSDTTHNSFFPPHLTTTTKTPSETVCVGFVQRLTVTVSDERIELVCYIRVGASILSAGSV